MTENAVLEAIRNRFACKKYSSRPVGKEELEAILEVGRLSPTSFGLEHYDIHVCLSKDIADVCFNQESMRTGQLSLVLTVKRGHCYDPDGEFVRKRAERFPGSVEEFVEDFRGYHGYLEEKGVLDMWARSQSYIALANMMTVAAAMGVQSCAIEGFDNDRLIERLGLDGEDDMIGIVGVFGYPDEKRERVRRNLDEMVVYHTEER